MSLTFSDRGTNAGAPAFRRGLVAIVSVLGLVIVVAGFATVAQGPQLRFASVDQGSAIRTPGVVLALRSDRALAEISASNITITPEAPFEVEQGDLDLRLVFTRPLQAGKTYTVEVAQVQPRGFGASSQWTTSFETPGEDIVFLRAAGAETELVGFSLEDSNPEVVYRAPGIVGFSPVGVVYAVHRLWQNESILELVDPETGAADRIALSPEDRVTSIANAAWGTSLVITLDTRVDGQETRGVLALLDTVGLRAPEVVKGPDGRPLQVVKAAVSPVTGHVLVWLVDQSLIVFEPLTGVAIPVGTATELWGFNSLGTSAVFVDSLGTVVVDIRTREEMRIPAGQLDGFPVFHELTTVSPTGESFQRVVVPGFADSPDFVFITVSGEDGLHRRIIGSATTPESIGVLQLSANGQYLALEINSTATGFGYAGLTPGNIRASSRVVILDVLENAVILDTPGFSFAW